MKKILLALLILFLAYAATGWFLAPRFAEKALRDFASEQFGLELKFENLLLYPFGFRTHLENLVILDRDGRTLFTASAVDAQKDPVGFWTQSAKFNRLVFEQPVLRIRDSEAGRRQVVDLLRRLVTWVGAPGEAVRIDALRLQGAWIASTSDSGASPKPVTPVFNFHTDSLGRSPSGSFQFAFDPAGASFMRVDGEMTWKPAGPDGLMRFNAPDGHFPVPAATGMTGTSEYWSALSVRAPFTLGVSDQGILLQVRNALLAAKSVQLGLQPLAGINADDLTADVSLDLNFGPQGLVLREVSARTGKFTFTGLSAGSSAWVKIPVAGSEIELSEYRFHQSQPVAFEIGLKTDPAGEIRLAGQYGPTHETGALVIGLQAVPMTSLFRPDSGILPQAIAGERLTARGRLQLSSPFASIALSGGFDPKSVLSFSGMTQYAQPLEDSRFDFELSGLDATRVSSWMEAFAGRRIVSGAVGASLSMRAEKGRLAGRWGLFADTLGLQDLNQASGDLDGDPDFIFALLQDSDRHIEFTVPLDGKSRAAGMALSGWLSQETRRYLSGLDKQPFDTLARMLGTGSENLEAVSFEAGQAGLTPHAVAQLEWLKTALQWRPALALRVRGGYDPEADRYALASQQIRLHVNLATAVSATDRANSAPVDFSDPRAQSVLDEFAGSRLGKVRMEEISRSFRRAEGGESASRSELENSAFYRALFDALVENEQIAERALLSLARFRARTVIDQLARYGVDRERLESGELEAKRASVGLGVPTQFELLVSAPPLAEPRREEPSRVSTGSPF